MNQSYQRIDGMRRTSAKIGILPLLVALAASSAEAQNCFPPLRQLVPTNPADAREFSDIISDDFET